MTPLEDSHVTFGMIRKYENKDMGIVIEVWQLASAQAHSFLDPEFVAKAELNLREIYLPKTETWVYEVEGAVVGFISMIGNEIGGLFVHPQFQGKGIGTGLVNFISKIFIGLQIEVFEKNTVGKSLYLKSGFRLNKCMYPVKDLLESPRFIEYFKESRLKVVPMDSF